MPVQGQEGLHLRGAILVFADQKNVGHGFVPQDRIET